MSHTDDDLKDFSADGLALPPGGSEAVTAHDGARIWTACYGAGKPVILLHGGLGHSGNFGKQVPALVSAGHRVIVIDSRGHGRSTRDDRPFSYALMAGDVRAVMDALGIAKARVHRLERRCLHRPSFWQARPRSGLPASSSSPATWIRAGPRISTNPTRWSAAASAGTSRTTPALSPTPGRFDALLADLGTMQRSQPNYSTADLAAIEVPVWSVLGEGDELSSAIMLNISPAASPALPSANSLASAISRHCSVQPCSTRRCWNFSTASSGKTQGAVRSSSDPFSHLHPSASERGNAGAAQAAFPIVAHRPAGRGLHAHRFQDQSGGLAWMRRQGIEHNGLRLHPRSIEPL